MPTIHPFPSESMPLGEAKLRYFQGNFQIISPGTFVRCAVTGQPIPLTRLSYWNVTRQEAYYDARAAYQSDKKGVRSKE